MTILYEVYDKRAILHGIDGLVLLDRDTDQNRAKKSARAWGGVVMKVTARILNRYPLQREVIHAELFFIHTPRPPKLEDSDQITMKALKGKLRMFNRGLYKKGRQ